MDLRPGVLSSLSGAYTYTCAKCVLDMGEGGGGFPSQPHQCVFTSAPWLPIALQAIYLLLPWWVQTAAPALLSALTPDPAPACAGAVAAGAAAGHLSAAGAGATLSKEGSKAAQLKQQ